MTCATRVIVASCKQQLVQMPGRFGHLSYDIWKFGYSNVDIFCSGYPRMFGPGVFNIEIF